MSSVVYARRGMVASAHPLATRIGVDILRKGGNAVDAAIAVNAALGFLEPMSCGPGGDLFAILWDPGSRRIVGLNASGRAPQSVRADKIAAQPDGTIPLRSPQAWTVPGAVDGWFELHGRFGRLPMKELLAPAIAAAEEGEPVPRVIAGMWGASFDVTADFAATFLPEGRAPRQGEIFRNPSLAKTYRALVEGGRAAFYEGEIAGAVAALSRSAGGFLERADLAAHRSDWVEPISTTYRDAAVWELPPPGQGLTTLQMLNLLESFDLKAMGRDSPDFWHVMVEAKKLAFEDRARYIGDAAVPVEALLSKEYASRRAGRIDLSRAARKVSPGLSPGETTVLCAGDESGMLIALIQSIYLGFGSGHAVAGFALQNRGAQFDLRPGRPNSIAPGKRPFHTIIPALVTRGGEPWIAFGVMGAEMQPQGQAQVLVNVFDFGMDLQQAGDAPRFRHDGSSEPTGTAMTDGGAVALEPEVPLAIRRELQRRGHRLEDAPPVAFGGYQAVARQADVFAGATERRKDGCALGY